VLLILASCPRPDNRAQPMTTTRDELALRIAIATIDAYLDFQYPFHAKGNLRLSGPMQDAITKAVLAELDAVTTEEKA